MNYGSSSYGSVAYGGLQASGYAFFFRTESLTEGFHSRSIEYPGNATYFEIIANNSTGQLEESGRVMRIYTHNDPAETPQLQTTTGLEAFYTQSIIGAARFITVEVEQPPNPLIYFYIDITGNEYFQ